MNLILQEAIRYRKEKDLSIIPLNPYAKKPFFGIKEFQERKASEKEIIRWWAEFPTAMIGIMTGKINGLFVLDLDPNHNSEQISEYLPDSLITPTSTTPRGGSHLYFEAPKDETITIGSGLFPNIDFRCNGGFIAAPPSRNKYGKSYRWNSNLSFFEVPLQSLPDKLYKYIINKKSTLYIEGCKEDVSKSLQNPTFLTSPYIWENGVRDHNLYHVALSLAKTNNDKDYIKQVLRAIIASWGEQDEEWIKDKVESALKRENAKKRNLKQEIEAWISLQDTYIYLTDTLQNLQVLTKEEKNNAYVIFNRLVKEGKIEKWGAGRGCYRIIDQEIKRTRFIKEKIEDFPIILPFNLNDLCKLYPKSVIILAGSKGSGKTALALKIALDNQNMIPVRYMHSEGGDEEFSERMQNWGIQDESQIRFEPIKCSRNFHDYVTDEKKIFIVDYLEVHQNFYEVAIPIKKIHDKLEKGIAIICLQKKAGYLLGRGDEFSQEVARLYLSMDYLKEELCTKITIVNAKAPKGDENLTGWFRKVKITRKGTRLTPLETVWYKPFAEEKPKYGKNWQDKD